MGVQVRMESPGALYARGDTPFIWNRKSTEILAPHADIHSPGYRPSTEVVLMVLRNRCDSSHLCFQSWIINGAYRIIDMVFADPSKVFIVNPVQPFN